MSASFFDAIGHMGEQVALSWLILDLTDNPFMVGVSLALRMAPLFFLGIPAGTIADMVDRRLLIRSLNIVMGLLMVGIGALLYLEMLQVWHLLAFAVVGGCLSAIHQAARQSFAFDVVGRENLLTGLAYVGLGMRLGGLVGAVAAGYLIDGPGAHMAYWMLASGYIVSTLLLSFIRSPGQAAARSRQPIMENLREFGGELRRNTPLLTLVIIVAATETLGFSSGATLPSLARDVLNVGAEGLGWLNGFRSGGAVVAILLLSLFGEVGRRGALLLLNLLVFGAALVLLGQSPVVATFLPGGGTSGESASLILGQSPAFVIALLATGNRRWGDGDVRYLLAKHDAEHRAQRAARARDGRVDSGHRHRADRQLAGGCNFEGCRGGNSIERQRHRARARRSRHLRLLRQDAPDVRASLPCIKYIG